MLNAAYDDSAGVTEAFNRNLLVHLNTTIGTDFEPAAFAHEAMYVPERGRVEMHLVSERDQVVTMQGEGFEIGAGESIHTENSYKYHPSEFVDLAAGAGFEREVTWTDPDGYFAVMLLRAA